MELHFAKWHGSGNDFILVDDRQGVFPAGAISVIRWLCDRHFGIGSDGLILVQAPQSAGLDFHMEFFNPDGSKSFCGNGSRCAFAFWSQLGNHRHEADFSAIDGEHRGAWVGSQVAITLPPVGVIERATDGPLVDFINTGSPHELVWVEDVAKVDLETDGRARRHAARHGSAGSNVNYVQAHAKGIRIRTYERGVEAETLSCGSGVVAAALSALERGQVEAPVAVVALGGELLVEAKNTAAGGYTGVRLIGPVAEVFKGKVTIRP
ncbi:MAG: diaminopimelate epimerase [Flavobacteriales bacterium]|nr:diaminopimelate epimerase [Flavobacteriales bacterium]